MNLTKRHLPAVGLLACLFMAFLGQRSEAANPSWWMSGTTQIIETSGTASNYSPANLGQLKFVAKQAKVHLDAKISGGAGSTITTLVSSFEPRTGQGYTQAQIDAFKAENYQPINLGQLKAVAKPFYDRLLAAGYNTKANLITRGYPSDWAFNYPWDPATPVADNYVPANLGQLKMIFSFDLDGFDADLDGLPDAWEILHFGNTTSQNGSGDADGDGLTNLQEFQNGTNPKNYYDPPKSSALSIISGNSQVGNPSTFASLPLVVQVNSGTTKLVNAPVTFTVSGTVGRVATGTSGSGLSSTFTVVTGTDGRAQVWYEFPAVEVHSGTIQVTSGTAQTYFTATTSQFPGDGLTLWLKSDAGITVSGSNEVSAWADQSGSGKNLAQATSSQRPTLQPNVVNGKPVIRFDGSDDNISVSSTAGWGSEFTVTFLIKPLGVSNYSQRIFALGGWGQFQFHSNSNGAAYVGTNTATRIVPGTGAGMAPNGTVAVSDWQSYMFTFQSGTGTLYKNGNVWASKAMDNPSSWTGFALGTTGTGPLNADMAELMVHARALSIAELNTMQGYLVEKYNLTPDSDNDGISDEYEQAHGLDLRVNDAAQDPDGDGQTNLQEFQNGTDPKNYYDPPKSPTLSIISGNSQVGEPSTFASLPLVVQVNSGTTKLVNAPVTFTVSGTVGRVATGTSGSGLSSTSTVVTGTDGRAQVWYEFPAAEVHSGTIQVTSGTAQTYFTATTSQFPGDGLTLWLKSDAGITVSGSNEVSAWADQSGSGKNLAQATSSQRPTLQPNVVNGKPAVRFDASDDNMTVSSTAGWGAEFTVTFLIKPLGVSNYSQRIFALGGWGQFYFHSNSNGAAYVGTNTATRIVPGNGAGMAPNGTVFANLWQSYMFTFQSGTGTLYKNGHVWASKAMDNPSSWTGFALGTTGTGPLNADVAELMVHSRALSIMELDTMQGYLVEKYDLTPDSDNDGISDEYEQAHGLDLRVNDAAADPDGDGLTNLQEFQNGSDPKDYYNGAIPLLQKTGGDSQLAENGAIAANPLVVKVMTSGSVALANAPVTFSITGSNGQIATSGTGAFSGTQNVVTGTAGTASIYLKLSGTVGAVNQVRAQVASGTSTTSVTFSATTRANNTLTIVSGNNQAGPPSTYVVEPLVVEVRSGTGGALLINEPVLFTVASGSGKLSTTFGGTVTTTGTTLYTGTNGRAQIYHQLGSGTATVNTVSVTSGTAGTATFTAKTTLADGLWAKWKLDEGTGTTVADSTGLTVSGTLVNSPTWDPGFDGRGGMKFLGFTSEGGSNSYVTMGNPADRSLDFGLGSFSISVWVKYTDGTHPVGQYGRRIVSKGHHGHNPGYTIVLENDGRLWTGIGSTLGAAANSLFFRTQNEFNDGKWHHVVTVFDRAASTARVYVDGAVQPLAKDSNTGGTIDSGDPTVISYSALTTLNATRTDMPLTISSHTGVYDFFKGEVDDVSFYRKALSASDVTAIYNYNGDGDSLPDWWEWKYLQTLAQGDTGNDDGDSRTNLQEYQNGSDPKDYYNGAAPILQKVSGDAQLAENGAVAANPLVVKVMTSGSVALGNAPVTFSISGTNGQIATTGTGPFATTQTVVTATTGTTAGIATIYLKLSGTVGATNQVLAQATSGTATTSVTFSATTRANNTLTIVSGNNQAGLPSTYVVEPLVVEVRSGSGGALLINEPVLFTVASGSGKLSTTFGGTVTTTGTTLYTGTNGRAQIYHQLGSGTATVNTVSVTSGTAGTATFAAKTTLADGLWAKWKLDEGTGSTVADSTGLTVSGTLVNSPTWDPGFDGRVGMKFLGFTSEGGSNSYVTMGNPADRSLDFGQGSFSISAWVKFTDGTFPAGNYGRRIISKGHAGFNPGYTIVLEGDGCIWTGIGSTVSTPAQALFFHTQNEFDDGKWHHVVSVFDRQASTARLYVDGVAQPLGQYPDSGGTIDPGNPTVISYPGLTTLSATRTDMPLTISSHTGVYDYFKGEVDDVSFYRKALSGSEVTAIYNYSGDGDSLPDWWEWKNLGTLAQGNTGDDDQDGQDNLAEYTNGTGPNDYYNGTLPSLQKLSGDGQTGAADTVLLNPLVVQILSSGSAPLNNAPVTFSISGTNGQIASSGTGAFGSTVDIRTGSAGTASVYLKVSGTEDAVNQVQAEVTSGTSRTAVTFSATTRSVSSGSLSIVGGNYQTGLPNNFVDAPLRVEVRNSGTLLANTPVVFTVTSGSGKLAERKAYDSVLSGTVTVQTDADGIAEVFYKQWSGTGITSTITTQSGTLGTVVFSEKTTQADGLLSRWKLDEGTGAATVDATGLTVSGILLGNPDWTIGFDGQGALSFSGSSDCVNMGDSLDSWLNMGSASFSIAMWIKFSEVPASGSTMRIIGKGGEDWGPGYFVEIGSDGSIATGIGANSSNEPEALLFKTTDSFDDNAWHHVAVVYDRYYKAEGRIYVDGAAQSLEKVGNTGGSVSGSQIEYPELWNLNSSGPEVPFVISSDSGTGEFFEGSVDDVRIYRKALSDAEVAGIWNVDGDSDGLPDWWEKKFLGTLAQNGDDYGDADSLNNLQEYFAGTNPAQKDTDGDSMPDDWELDHRLDPLNDRDSGEDADGDGLTNLKENEDGGDPNDYFSQGAVTLKPVITIAGGNHQMGAPEGKLPQSLSVEVRSGTGGAVLAGAPVYFVTGDGNGSLSEELEDGKHHRVLVYTGSNGVAEAWHWMGAEVNMPNTVTVQAGDSNVLEFESQSLGRDNMVGHWKFDEGSGTAALDSGPFNFTGTLKNGPTWEVRNLGESVLHFTGSGAHVAISSGTSEMLDFDRASFSVMAWVKSGTALQAGRIVSKDAGDTTPGYYLGINSSGQFEAGVGTTAGGATSEIIHFATTGSYNDNVWHSVALIVDRSTATARIFVDGAAMTIAKQAGTGGIVSGTDGTLLSYSSLQYLSGSRPETELTVASINGIEAFFEGAIDDLKIFRGVLSPERIHTLHTDSDENGMADSWERTNFGDIGQDPSGDNDADGSINLAEFINGTDPWDFFNGQQPVLSIVDGNNQGDLPGETLARPFAVRLSNNLDRVMVGAIVEFSNHSGGGSLRPVEGGVTDNDGIARCSLQLPNSVGDVVVKVTYVSAELYISASVGDEAAAPHPPEKVEVIGDHGETAVLIKWEDRSDNESGFLVERSLDGTAWTEIAELPKNTVSYRDEGIHPQSVYQYRVSAFVENP